MVRSALGKFALVVAIAVLALPPAAQPQGFPSKPIRIIVPYTPGSPNDVLARLLAQQLQGKLGQAVVVDNKPGGGTTIGSKTRGRACRRLHAAVRKLGTRDRADHDQAGRI